MITASYDPTTATPGGSMEVLLGNGDGTFQPAVTYTVPGALIETVYPGDFNGDGHIDLAVATTTLGNSQTMGLAIFLNNGNGTFHLGQQTTNSSPFGVSDFNRDGKLDLVVGNYSSWHLQSVSILFGSGNGTFTSSGTPYPITYGSFPSADIAIQDFNQDGYPDLAVVTSSKTLTILLTNPDGSLTRAPSPPAIDNGSSITAGDFNHDGHMDVAIVTGEEESQIDVLLGKGDGTFQYRTVYGTDGSWGFGPGDISNGDLNHDGYLDLVSTNETGTVNVLYGKSGGSFNAELATGPGWMNSDATAAGDFNGDHNPDVAVLYGSTSPYQTNSTVSIYQGTGNGHFKPLGTHYKTGTSGAAFAAGDVNGDGKLDLVVAGFFVSGVPTASVLLGNGNGTFQTAKLLSSQVCGLSGPQLLLADVNNDGKLDLVTGNGVSLGDGSGNFGACIPFASGFGLSGAIVVGDFNKDGKLDLAFISQFGGLVEIFLGDGTGKFNSTPSYQVVLPYQANFGTYISVGHFTQNGNLGLVVGAKEADVPNGMGSIVGEVYGAITILGGNGDGTFMAPVTYYLPQALLGLAVADFNRDGLDDVAALNDSHSPGGPTASSHSYLSLFTSNGDGTAQPAINFGAGEMGLFVSNTAIPDVMSVADFNRDGAPDIAGIDLSALGVLLNSAGVSVSLSASPNPVALGQKLTLKAFVSPSLSFSGSVSSGAQVTFYDGSTKLGSADIFNGEAILTTSTLSAGSHTLNAVYSGNSVYETLRSNSVKEVVTQ